MLRSRGNELHRVKLDNEDHMKNPYPKGFEKVSIPAGKSGDWEVRKITATKEELGLFNLRLIRDGFWHRIVPPGDYTQLRHGHTIVMSDTPAEAHEHKRLIDMAEGRVLLNGLGLGFALHNILRKKEVEQVTIIEQSSDVINLVAPSFKGQRVEIIHADALTWRPKRGQGFNVVWHDIWNDICEDNKEQMTKLKRAYARRSGWQACWSGEYMP